ncbi:acyl carrier protein, partial [Lactobacillus crispatus]|uniref:acyl carrier protein n=1 Tax=Lactobacillus crispatus TaxID=47770 RepID=UPI00105C3AB0
YVALRNERGRLVDTVLRFHEQHGAVIADVAADYRPSDAVNLGSGVLVKYDIHRRRRNEVKIEGVTSPAETDEDVDAFVVNAVMSILQKGAPDEIELTRPLFELGLDSADLLDLNERISGCFGIALE